MLDPKVAQDARQAWDKFMQQVNRMECRMLTAMADQIDQQWAEMVAPVAAPENEPFCWAAGIKEKRWFSNHPTKRDADDAAVEAAMGIGCQEWDVWPLYAAPVAVRADQPPKPFGVAAAAATAADVSRSVAETPEPRQVDQSCCGGRQEPDVGEGWRWVEIGETLCDGDQCMGITPGFWFDTDMAGDRLETDMRLYRRRVTPLPESQQPDAGEGPTISNCDINSCHQCHNPVWVCEGCKKHPDGFQDSKGLWFCSPECYETMPTQPCAGEGWRKIGPGEILQAGDEVDVGINCRQWVPTERGGVRIGDEEDNYRRRVKPVVQVEAMSITDTWAAEVARLSAENHLLKAEVERLRTRPNELKQIHKALFVLDQLSATHKIDQEMWSTIRDMLFRLEDEK